jgi:DNA sulfur modification protein DndD
MLRLTGLRLNNFGPFKGEQSIDFPQEDGVTIIYGENMRGKTSLLNAIRFAFFGRILGRGRRDAALHKVGNWEEAAENKVYGFEVGLDMTHAGARYRLVRTFKPRPGVTEPQDDSDYVQDYFLERDGVLLSRGQSKTEIERILPEQIARFFLFDGELLQEYEDLLVAESDMGPKIADAIERILGMPVLTDTRDSLTAAKERAENRHARAAQGDQKTREFGTQLAALQSERGVLQADLERQEKDLDGLRTRKTSLEEAMRKMQRVAALFEKRDVLEGDIKGLKKDVADKKEGLGGSMTSAWCALLGDRMRAKITDLRARESQLQTVLIRASVLANFSTEGEKTCPACLQPVAEEARNRVRESLAPYGGSAGPTEEQEIAAVRRRIAALEGFVAEANPQALRLEWDSIARDERQIHVKSNEVKEIDAQIADVDEEAVRRTRSDLESVIKQISLLEQGLNATREALHKNAVYRDNLQRKLDKFAGSSFDVERKRRDLAADLEMLFSKGIDVFREQLRRRVEADATEHFLQLTSEPDYAGLRINDSYGLTIIHKDGSDIPVRSAGAEHIVALSLVGALQNNAPLRGPIIIDSPFGRLDATHTDKTVAALPSMAKQVVVLVYEDELAPARARAGLGGHLNAEWTLVRRSARHTELKPRKD